LKQAALLGAAYIDLELAAGRKALGLFLHRRQGSRLIVSRHFFGMRPSRPERVYHALRATGADVIKMAYDATDGWENVLALEFLSRARRDRAKGVAIAMGEAGEASRILYRKFGGWATYAAPETGAAAALGQLPASALRQIFRASSCDRRTRVFGLVGNPVSQSKGFLLHNRLFAHYGLNAVYCRFLTRDLEKFFRELMPYLHGCSVTTPFKQSAVRHVRADVGAKAIGALNTIYRRGSVVVGSNCDAPAALDALRRSVRGKRVLVLGAGGAARAVVYEAVRRGARVTVANRTPEKASSLAREFGVEAVSLAALEPARYDVVINSTSAGMVPQTEATAISGRAFRGALVMDAVYTPPVTRFLMEAQGAGARVVGGMEMFLRQAVAQFELFVRVRPALSVARRLVRSAQGHR
jgi:3-dehydroquinate dehydratase/shikimate dehydrogenase